MLKIESKKIIISESNNKYLKVPLPIKTETRIRPLNWYKNHAVSRKFAKKFCEACGLESKLHTHHIDGDYINNVKKNIQTLCIYCHNYLHLVQKRMKWAYPGQFPKFEVFVKKEKDLILSQKQ